MPLLKRGTQQVFLPGRDMIPPPTLGRQRAGCSAIRLERLLGRVASRNFSRAAGGFISTVVRVRATQST